MDEIIAEKVITATYYKLSLIKDQISQIRLHSFPSDNPKQLAEIIKAICNLFQEYLLRLQNDASSQPVEVARLAKFIANTTGEIASHLRFVEGASIERTPWNMVLPFQSFVKDIYQPNSFLIVRPQWQYNYKVIWDLVEVYKEHIEKGLSKKVSLEQEVFNTKLYIVSFPGFEKNNLLLHANLGHEIGHPIASEFLATEAENKKAKPQYLPRIAEELEKVLEKILEKYLRKDATELEKYAQKGKLQEHIVFLRKRGLEEIISDLISVNLFGIASLFATEEIADISQSIDEVKAPQYYPPLRMRLRLMYEELLSNGLDSIFNMDVQRTSQQNDFNMHVLSAVKERLDIIKATISIDKDKNHIKNDPIFKIAYDSILEVLPKIKGFIKTRISGHMFEFEKIHNTVFPLCDRIAHRIPPNAVEIDPFAPVIADIPAILNAGWFYKITCLSKLSSYRKQGEYVNELNILNDLLLKAIEISHVHQKYFKWVKDAKK